MASLLKWVIIINRVIIKLMVKFWKRKPYLKYAEDHKFHFNFLLFENKKIEAEFWESLEINKLKNTRNPLNGQLVRVGHLYHFKLQLGHFSIRCNFWWSYVGIKELYIFISLNRFVYYVRIKKCLILTQHLVTFISREIISPKNELFQ